MRTAIVTGSSGFIGSNLLSKLISMRIELGLFARSDLMLSNSCLSRPYIVRDNITFDSLDKMFNEISCPDTIFHLAGGSLVSSSYKHPRTDFTKTVDSTSILLEFIRMNKITTKIIVASSASVYGNAHNRPIQEDSVHNPSSPYGYHCSMKEDIVNMYNEIYGINTVITRIFSACGIGLKKQLLWDICHKLSNEKHIEVGGTGNEVRDWVPIELCVDALLAIATNETSSFTVLNIGSGREVTVEEMVKKIFFSWNEFFDTNKTYHFNNINRKGNPEYLVANISALQSIFDFQVPDVSSSVKKYVNWFINEQL